MVRRAFDHDRWKMEDPWTQGHQRRMAQHRDCLLGPAMRKYRHRIDRFKRVKQASFFRYRDRQLGRERLVRAESASARRRLLGDPGLHRGVRDTRLRRDGEVAGGESERRAGPVSATRAWATVAGDEPGRRDGASSDRVGPVAVGVGLRLTGRGGCHGPDYVVYRNGGASDAGADRAARSMALRRLRCNRRVGCPSDATVSISATVLALSRGASHARRLADARISCVRAPERSSDRVRKESRRLSEGALAGRARGRRVMATPGDSSAGWHSPS